jgi:hypothetical protein
MLSRKIPNKPWALLRFMGFASFLTGVDWVLLYVLVILFGLGKNVDKIAGESS